MRYELITFGISGQLFGLDIMTIREIRAWSPVTRLPRVPDYVAGVVNLRGAVLPVFGVLGGYLYLGHSETLLGDHPDLVSCGTTTYRRK